MGQDFSSFPSISINDVVLQVTDHFRYLRSTISNNLLLDNEIDKRIVKAEVVMAKLNKSVWNNSQLTLRTKLKLSQACILSSLL